MNGKKVLVTGGAGFIGSHLVDRLLSEGHDVLVLDNFSSGCMKNLSAHIDNNKLQVIEVNITDFQGIKDYFKEATWVFHLAALADIIPSIQNPLKYHAANVDGTISVLEAARKAGVERLIYAASSSCYGIPDKYPTPETALIKPEYPYALTKYLAEQYVLHWGKVYNLPVVSLRLFNVYGLRARTSGAYGAAFGVFLTQKINNKPFTVIGDGTQTRDFTFVTDIVDAFIMAAKSDIRNEVLNIGSGNTYSINYLVELLGGDVVHIPKRPGEPDCTYADISKIQKILGWNTKVSFEEGVKVMLGDIDYWKDAPLWTPETIHEATREWFECLSK